MDDYPIAKLIFDRKCIGVKFPRKGKRIKIQRREELEYRFWRVYKNEHSECMFEILNKDRQNSGFFMGVSHSDHCLKLISTQSDEDQEDQEDQLDKRWFRCDTASQDEDRRLMHIDTESYVTIDNEDKKLKLHSPQTTSSTEPTPTNASRSSESSGSSESSSHLNLNQISILQIKYIEEPV